jgi:hypothetical protein
VESSTTTTSKRGRPSVPPATGEARGALSQGVLDELRACVEALENSLRSRFGAMDSPSRVETVHNEQRAVMQQVAARLRALAA